MAKNRLNIISVASSESSSLGQSSISSRSDRIKEMPYIAIGKTFQTVDEIGGNGRSGVRRFARGLTRHNRRR